jgi:DNA-binding NtrC family response regulator
VKEKARILIVDDDEGIRLTCTAILEENGYCVETAETGKEAILKTNDSFFNAALIDIRLPDMEGTQLLTAMKETTPKMVKIILTGYPALKNAVDAVNNGASAYVLKPPDMNELLKTLEENLLKQEGEKRTGEAKIAEFIQRRAQEIDAEKNKEQRF